MAEVSDLKNFFNHGLSRALTMSELAAFWKACSDEEKAQYKAAVDRWDKKSFYC